MCQCLLNCSKRVHSCTERFFEHWAGLIVNGGIFPFIIALVVYSVLASGIFKQQSFSEHFDAFLTNAIPDDHDYKLAERSDFLAWSPANFKIIFEATQEGDSGSLLTLSAFKEML